MTTAERLAALLARLSPEYASGQWGPAGAPYRISQNALGVRRITVRLPDDDMLSAQGATVADAVMALEAKCRDLFGWTEAPS